MFYREAGQFKTSYAADQAAFPIAQDRVFIAIWLAVGFILVPLLSSEYLFRAIFIPFLIMALAALGLNLLVGYCGQLSLGTGGFMAVGAYAAYNLCVRIPGLNSLVAFLLAGGVATLVGFAFGIPSLRLKGYYLAVATLASQFLLDWVFSRVAWLTNYTPSGSITAPPVTLFGLAFETPVKKYLLCLTILVLFAVVAKNIVRGRIGRAWMATRDMDVAAEIIGIRPMYAKLSAFAVSSFFIGVAGALWAFVHLGSWEPLAFDINRSFSILFMVIIGGLGSILGSLLGAAFITVLPLFLNQMPQWFGISISTAMISHLEVMIFGALIVFFLIVEPLGLARLWRIGKEKLRLWPFPY
ncbi:MAG TPA: branched-chain amino acid ABC transporter permease [Burkholderiales bacterium]|jgi:branched-chain amino acid transport system permease protein|nr:branched-chain amino acid ABC transporter permease [Burkholderiales bacterium]